MKKNAVCAVEVIEIIRSILSPLIRMQQLACTSYRDDSKTHHLVVESSHPYKPATVEEMKVPYSCFLNAMLITNE